MDAEGVVNVSALDGFHDESGGRREDANVGCVLGDVGCHSDFGQEDGRPVRCHFELRWDGIGRRVVMLGVKLPLVQRRDKVKTCLVPSCQKPGKTA